jgi:hypothetical protein
MSLAGVPAYEALRKRRYRARLLREADPAKFCLRRHRRKLKRKEPRIADWRFGANFMDELRIDWDLVL